MKTVVDTTGLLAAFDTTEPDHVACADFLERESGPFIMSPLVLAEIDYMVSRRLGIDAELTFLDDVRSGAYTLAPFDDDDFAATLDVVKQYCHLDIGMTEASNVVLAQRYATARMFTLDGHYRAVRPLGRRGCVRVLPEDA